jgi:hypothetical protein
MNEFVIETEDVEHDFETFLGLGRGVEVEVNERNRRFLLSVASELGNCEVYFALWASLQTNVTVCKFCEDFECAEIGAMFSEKAIEFLAVHFFELDRSFQNDLSFSVLYQILGHPSLALETEDSLLEFIISQSESNRESVSLLEFVRFEFLRQSTIKKFVGWSLEHFSELDITISLWRTITNRLSEGDSAVRPLSRRYPTGFHPWNGSPLDGIITYLTRRYGGNVDERGIVIVSASSEDTKSWGFARNAVNLVNHQHDSFYSHRGDNQWLCYDFKDRRIELSDYSIAAHTSNYFLRSWMVEGSEDGSTWNVLDERKDNTEADSSHPITTFSVSTRMKCRFIRLRQTGKSCCNGDCLILYGLEVFGCLDE